MNISKKRIIKKTATKKKKSRQKQITFSIIEAQLEAIREDRKYDAKRINMALDRIHALENSGNAE